MKKNIAAASLRRPKPARTVLLRMAADERRAQRIQALKAEHPEVTWKQIADYVGVSERSAHGWRATGAIDPKNASRLNRFFQEHGSRIPDDFVWRGDHEDVPNLMDVLSSGNPHGPDPEELLLRILSRLDTLERLSGRLDELEEQIRLLRAERAADAAEALRRNEEVLRAIRESR